MITGLPGPAIVSNSGAARPSIQRASTRSCSSNRGGERSIETVTTTTRSSAVPASKMPSEPAAVKRTKANSPPCEIAIASRCAVSFGARPILAITYIRTNFAAVSPAARPNTVSGRFHTSARLALIPTAMKKSPRSKLLKGSISASSSWRNSESARSTPARKAPSEGDRPIFSMMSAAPITSNRAAAVNTSRPP